MTKTAALVLAAGKGTRMRSDRPKVLHTLLGEPMLWYVFKALEIAPSEDVLVVIGHEADRVRAAFPDFGGTWVEQAEQRGTGHALQVAWDAVAARGADACLVVNGDTPLIPAEALAMLDETCRGQGVDLAFLSVRLPDPGAFGRVVRAGDGTVAAIVEAKDYDPGAHGPLTGEVNAGIYWLRLETVAPLLNKLSDDNAGGEFYITDLVGLAVQAGLKVVAEAREEEYLLGVNSPAELAWAEELVRANINAAWMERGVTMHRPSLVTVGPRSRLGPGVELAGPCEIYGESRVESGALLESNLWMLDSVVRAGARVRPYCHIEGADVGPDCVVGPFARLRPGAVMEEGSRVGNFVEMKKARLGKGAKANHLSYLGDAEVGAGSNIGAGTITCNYDGKNKHATVLGENVFVGSNTALVAPVTVGEGALIGAGSVITKDVEPHMLAVARAPQKQVRRRK